MAQAALHQKDHNLERPASPHLAPSPRPGSCAGSPRLGPPTTFSVHQWGDLRAGLREIRRVTRGPVVIMTGDAERLRRFWLNEYAPEVIDTEACRYPSAAELSEGLGEPVTGSVVPVPLDCTDGFNEAYYGRPDALLDPAARRCCRGCTVGRVPARLPVQRSWSYPGPAVEEVLRERLAGSLRPKSTGGRGVRHAGDGLTGFGAGMVRRRGVMDGCWFLVFDQR
jgi:hypothetical protein